MGRPVWGTRLSDKNRCACAPPPPPMYIWIPGVPGTRVHPDPITHGPASESLARAVDKNVVRYCHLPVQTPFKSDGRPDPIIPRPRVYIYVVGRDDHVFHDPRRKQKTRQCQFLVLVPSHGYAGRRPRVYPGPGFTQTRLYPGTGYTYMWLDETTTFYTTPEGNTKRDTVNLWF